MYTATACWTSLLILKPEFDWQTCTALSESRVELGPYTSNFNTAYKSINDSALAFMTDSYFGAINSLRFGLIKDTVLYLGTAVFVNIFSGIYNHCWEHTYLGYNYTGMLHR